MASLRLSFWLLSTSIFLKAFWKRTTLVPCQSRTMIWHRDRMLQVFFVGSLCLFIAVGWVGSRHALECQGCHHVIACHKWCRPLCESVKAWFDAWLLHHPCDKNMTPLHRSIPSKHSFQITLTDIRPHEDGICHFVVGRRSRFIEYCYHHVLHIFSF